MAQQQQTHQQQSSRTPRLPFNQKGKQVWCAPASVVKNDELLESWVVAARRHGVPSHKVVPWVRRKLGPAVIVLRFRGDGTLGCSIPCILCQRELKRFDLRVHCYLGAAGDDSHQWFSGRMSDADAPTPVLTAGQRRTLNLDPGPNRAKKGQELQHHGRKQRSQRSKAGKGRKQPSA